MKSNGIKSILYIIGGSALLLGMPSIAYAEPGIGWSSSDMASKQDVNPDTQAVGMDMLGDVVFQGTTICASVAVVIFVFRVVLTAVDKMAFSGQQFSSIKWIGSYGTSEWKEIFRKFAVQLGIVAVAWTIVNLVTGLALQLLTLLPS